jgi:hypothetical protein
VLPRSSRQQQPQLVDGRRCLVARQTPLLPPPLLPRLVMTAVA